MRPSCPTTMAGDIEDDDEESENEGTKSTRIQQPNVPINPNFVKIKIEQDYNPIIAPKEPLENNETQIEGDHNLIVEPKKEPCEENEIELQDNIQSQAMLSQVK